MRWSLVLGLFCGIGFISMYILNIFLPLEILRTGMMAAIMDIGVIPLFLFMICLIIRLKLMEKNLETIHYLKGVKEGVLIGFIGTGIYGIVHAILALIDPSLPKGSVHQFVYGFILTIIGSLIIPTFFIDNEPIDNEVLDQH